MFFFLVEGIDMQTGFLNRLLPSSGIPPEELRFSAANEEEQGLWRLDTETLDFPSRPLVKKTNENGWPWLGRCIWSLKIGDRSGLLPTFCWFKHPAPVDIKSTSRFFPGFYMNSKWNYISQLVKDFLNTDHMLTSHPCNLSLRGPKLDWRKMGQTQQVFGS